jgi:hypothetical protein
MRTKWKGVDEYCRKFTPDGQPVTFEVPVYRLPGDIWMAMDSNHRLSALAVARPAFAVAVYEVWGPLDERALSDLRTLGNR